MPHGFTGDLRFEVPQRDVDDAQSGIGLALVAALVDPIVHLDPQSNGFSRIGPFDRLEQRRDPAAPVSERKAGEVFIRVKEEDRPRHQVDSFRQVAVADRPIHLHQVLLDAIAGDLHATLPTPLARPLEDLLSASRSISRP